MATFSAVRKGWFTGGVMLKMPEPRWMRSVAAAQYPRKASLADRCEYSSRKWCSVAHRYLNPERSAAFTHSSSCVQADALGGVAVLVDHRGRDVHAVEDAELHGSRTVTRSSSGPSTSRHPYHRRP